MSVLKKKRGKMITIACENEDKCMGNGRTQQGHADGIGMSKAREDKSV